MAMNPRMTQLDQVVAKMRALGIRRLNDAQLGLEIDLDDAPPGAGDRDDDAEGHDESPLRAPRRATLKKFE